jgi:Papain family cysteine protease
LIFFFCNRAFSTVAQVESDAIRQNLLTTDDSLSVQQLLNCDTIDWGCDGGWTELGFAYVQENGLELDSDYPYTSYYELTGECTSKESKYVVTIDSYYTLATEDEMIDYVLTTGPISTCVDSASWQSYVDGIVSVCGDNVDHCIQIVGVDTDEGYWKVRRLRFYLPFFLFVTYLTSRHPSRLCFLNASGSQHVG